MRRSTFGLTGFAAVQRRLRETTSCPTCTKATMVKNVATHGFQPEPVTAETHCTCPGGPIDLQTRGHLNPLSLASGDPAVIG